MHNHIATGHQSCAKELRNLKGYFIDLPKPHKIKQIIQELRNQCVHCQRRPAILRRPYHTTTLPTRCREILLADYLYVRHSQYILVLVDGFSRKIILHATNSANAETMVKAVLQFRADFGLDDVLLLVTDQGSHFSNRLLQQLQKQLRFVHHFSMAHAHWTHGAAEVMNSSVLKHLRKLCSEYSLHEDDWPQLLPIVTFLINNNEMETEPG